MTGQGLAFTFEGLVIASVFYSLPFAVQPIAAAFAQVDASLRDASAMLGASPLRTFLRVTLPLSIEGVIAGVVLSFAHTVGEFGVVLMVGGNLPGVTRTVSIAIYDHVQALRLPGGEPDGAGAARVLAARAAARLRPSPPAAGRRRRPHDRDRRDPQAPVAAVRARRRIRRAAGLHDPVRRVRLRQDDGPARDRRAHPTR